MSGKPDLAENIDKLRAGFGEERFSSITVVCLDSASSK